MLNREQRRAQLKALNKKFQGIDIERETLTVPIKGSKETLKVDLTNFKVLYHMNKMCQLFGHIEELYPEEYAAAVSKTNESDKVSALLDLYDHVIYDFAGHVDIVFGEGAMEKIFGHRFPMARSVIDFSASIKDVAQAITVLMGSDLDVPGGTDSSKVDDIVKAAAGRGGSV